MLHKEKHLGDAQKGRGTNLYICKAFSLQLAQQTSLPLSA